jgi:hypothetical protein
MLLLLFEIFLLIGSLKASHPIEDIYDKAKKEILSFKDLKCRRRGMIFRVDDKKADLVMILLRGIGANDLLDLFNADDSDEFLIFFFFAYWGMAYNRFMIFHNVNSLYPLKIFPQKNLPLERIFENFRGFLYKSFRVITKGCCTNSSYPLESLELLGKFEALWYNRLERLAKRLLNENEFIKQSKQIKSMFRFFKKLFNYGLEFMLVNEHKRILKNVGKLEIENSSAVRNFHFLVDHFQSHLGKPNSVRFPEMSLWISLQSGSFIIFFSYFYSLFWEPQDDKKTNIYKDLLEGNIEILRPFVEKCFNCCTIGKYPIIFFREEVFDRSRYLPLGKTISEKTK